MQRSNISPSIIQDFFESASNAAAKGQAQWFTPPAWATALAQPLPDYRPTIIDLTCGDGQLLAAARTHDSLLFGCDIESIEQKARVNFMAADITKFYPLLRAVKWQCDLFTLNMPWDLHLYRERLEELLQSDCTAVIEAFLEHDGRTSHDTIDSTIAGICIAIDRMPWHGEGYCIANESTLKRLIFEPNAPHKALKGHIWAHISISGNICETKPKSNDGHLASGAATASRFRTGVIYFARQEQLKCYEADCQTMQDFEAVCGQLQRDRLLWRRGNGPSRWSFCGEATAKWAAACEEWNRLYTKDHPQYNISLDRSGHIRTHLSLFDNLSKRFDKGLAERLFDLNGKQPIQLVVQRAQRKTLEDAVAPTSPWRVDPALQAAVADAVLKYNSVRAPLYPLPQIQRLGYLDESDKITAIKTLNGAHGSVRFTAGQSYALRSTTVAVRRYGTKINLTGEVDKVEWTGQELAFFIRDNDDIERCFMDGRLRDSSVKVNLLTSGRNDKMVPDDDRPCAIHFSLQDLVAHFEVPEVPDVAATNPGQYQANLQAVDRIREIVNSILPPIQRWKLKPFQREDYARAAIHDGIILAHDTGLGKTIAGTIWSLLKVGYSINPDFNAFVPRSSMLLPNKPVLMVVPGDGHEQTADEIWNRFRIRIVSLDSQAAFKKLVDGEGNLPSAFYITSYTQLGINGATRVSLQAAAESADEEPGDLRGTLASLVKDKVAAITVDEGTKMKGEDTHIGLGVRQIQAPFRLVLSATPIKNRLPDVFRLAHYVCGGHEEPTPRLPYGNDDRFTFEADFMVIERNLTKEDLMNRPFRKKVPQVCNIHRAWKLFGPIILRRRKVDCGEQIVPKHRHVIRVPLGLEQAAVYQYHLQAKYLDKNGKGAPGAKLQALRVAAANPASELLDIPKNPPGMKPPQQPIGRWKSRYPYVPKIVTALKLMTQVMQRGEQAIIFGAFPDSLDAIGARLREAGIPFLSLDGRISQVRRGKLAKEFKLGPPRAVWEGLTQTHSPYPFCLAGVESMAELHSFHLCNNGIFTSYSWAWDKFEQAGNRFHRLNSPWDVNMWSVICEGTVDRKLEANIHEKGDAAGLVLDGALPGDYSNEVNYAELLQIAAREFQNVKTVDEDDLLLDWPDVRYALNHALKNWDTRPARISATVIPEIITVTKTVPAWRLRTRMR